MKSSMKYVWGAALIIFGILVLFGRIGFLTSLLFSLTWPMIIIGFSLLFFIGYMSKRPRGVGLLVPGGIFFTIGMVLLIGELISYRLVWPGFIASPAVGLLLLYIFGDRSPGLLVPIGTLFTVAGTCFFAQLLGLWAVLWPGFIMAPAVGLFLLYLTDTSKSGLLIPVFILTGISAVFFTIFALGTIGKYLKYIVGAVLVIVGIKMIIKKPSANGYDSEDYYEP